MPKEQYYQTKLIKRIEQIGGVVVNGTYTKAGIADLICGWPIAQRPLTDAEKYDLIVRFGTIVLDDIKPKLLHLHIEVKTKEEYEALFHNHIAEEKDGLYHVNPDFNGREVLQAHKLNEVRKRGGLALFAYDIKQVEDYIENQRLSIW